MKRKRLVLAILFAISIFTLGVTRPRCDAIYRGEMPAMPEKR